MTDNKNGKLLKSKRPRLLEKFKSTIDSKDEDKSPQHNLQAIA